MFETHIFVAAKSPTPSELHCLITHLFDKQNVQYKVSNDHRMVTVVTKKGTVVPKSYQFQSNTFEYKRSAETPALQAKEGDTASLSLKLCYSIHRTKGGRESPFDGKGHIKPHCQKEFYAYLESRLGVALAHYPPDASGPIMVGDISVAPFAFVTPEERSQKVWFTGACSVAITAKVTNADVFNALAGTAIGNRRSYGFGGVLVADLLSPPTANFSE